MAFSGCDCRSSASSAAMILGPPKDQLTNCKPIESQVKEAQEVQAAEE